MNFEYSEKSLKIQEHLKLFMDKNILPIEKEIIEYRTKNNWKDSTKIEELKKIAKKEGLWNLFLPVEYGKLSPGLTNLEYAPLAEIMGRCSFSSEIFNCSAPDTGNMEVLAKYGNSFQKKKWLEPLMNGDIRSAFLMTEPDVASSDATNIETSTIRNENEYVINGKNGGLPGE